MLARPRLIAFTDVSGVPRDTLLQRYAALAERALPATVLFIVRDYALSARERWLLAGDLAALARPTDQCVGIADRTDIARVVGAHAVHLPESGLEAGEARRLFEGPAFISRACHDPETALGLDADAVLLSPILEPRKGRGALGLPVLERVCAARVESSPLVYALGGVGAANAGACLAAGAAGVAVIGAALEPDPSELLEALKISR